MKLLDIIKGNTATFSFYRQGYIYYAIDVQGERYEFPIDLDDLGSATLGRQEKAITLMRYIRKALEDQTFVKARRAA